MCTPNSGWAPATNPRPPGRDAIQNRECNHGVGGSSTNPPTLAPDATPNVASCEWKNRVWSAPRFIAQVTRTRSVGVADSRMSVMAWATRGCGLISMNVSWFRPAIAIAWLNRTGWRTLATQYSASSTGAGAAVTVEMNGTVGLVGVKSASAEANSG